MVAQFGAAYDAAGNEARYLHEGEDRTFVGLDGVAAALVEDGSLVQRGVEELAGPVGDALHGAGHGRAVHVHVEDVHEDADAGAFFAGHGIHAPLYLDHLAVGGAGRRSRFLRHHAFGIAEEVEREPDEDDEDDGERSRAQQGRGEGAERCQKDDWVAFRGDGCIGWAHGVLQMFFRTFRFAGMRRKKR